MGTNIMRGEKREQIWDPQTFSSSDSGSSKSAILALWLHPPSVLSQCQILVFTFFLSSSTEVYILLKKNKK